MTATLELPMGKKKKDDVMRDKASDGDSPSDLALAEKLVRDLSRDRYNWPGGGKDEKPVNLDRETKAVLDSVTERLQKLTGHSQLAAGKILRIAALEWLRETDSLLEELENRRSQEKH